MFFWGRKWLFAKSIVVTSDEMKEMSNFRSDELFSSKIGTFLRKVWQFLKSISLTQNKLMKVPNFQLNISLFHAKLRRFFEEDLVVFKIVAVKKTGTSTHCPIEMSFFSLLDPTAWFQSDSVPLMAYCLKSESFNNSTCFFCSNSISRPASA